MKIIEIKYNQARKFIKDNTLTLKQEYIYFGLYVDNILVSVLGVKVNNGVSMKLHCNYTPIEHRHKGYFSILLDYIINLDNDMDILADCTDYSKNIYIRKGFEVLSYKEFKNFNITKVILRREEKCK